MPNIVVPELGESVVEARVAKWLKQEGDAVAAGEPLVEIDCGHQRFDRVGEHVGAFADASRGRTAADEQGRAHPVFARPAR